MALAYFWYIPSQNAVGNRLVGFGLIHRKPLCEPPKLLPAQVSHLLCCAGPLESAVLDSLVQQHKAVALPQQSLDPVAAPAAEQKQAVGERIQRKLLLYQLGKAVDAPPKVGVAAGKVDVFYPADVTQHDGSPG